MAKNCIICNSSDGKYKCPICLVYYCSVTCCQKHRMDKCLLVKSEEIECTDTKLNNTIQTHQLYPTADTIEMNKLELLASSKELKDILANPHLRTLLTTVNDAPDAANVMAKAMLEPIFVEFANACLDITSDKL